MRRLCLSLFVLSSAVIVGSSERAHAEALPELMFILDSSGSMSEPAGAERKIDAAKHVMQEIVPQVPANVAVGLTLYGHRRPGDCSDIETVFAPGATERQAILDQVMLMEPKGKTPLGRALLKVAAGLKTKDVETTILLVSDGVDTCGADPCAVVRQLKEAGVRFVLHVVGFDVDARTAQQLQCMAGEGGGQYFAADDADALLGALNAVSLEVAGKAEAAKAEFVSAGTGLGKLQITMPVNAEKSLKQLRLVRPSDGKVVKEIDAVAYDSTHPLVSGEYRVQVGFAQPNHGEATWTDLGTFAVAKGETRVVQLGSLSLNVPQELVDAPWQSRVNLVSVIIADAGTDEPVATVYDKKNGYYNFLPKPMLAGIYNVKFKYATATDDATVVARDVQVLPGKDTMAPLTSGIHLVGNLEGIAGWDLVPRGTQTDVAIEDGGSAVESQPLLVVRGGGKFGGSKQSVGYTYLVPPGEYDLLVYVEGMDEPLPAGEGLHIAEGQVLQFNAGF